MIKMAGGYKRIDNSEGDANSFEQALADAVKYSTIESTITPENITQDDIEYAADCLAIEETGKELTELSPEEKSEYMDRVEGYLLDGTIVITGYIDIDVSSESYFATSTKEYSYGENDYQVDTTTIEKIGLEDLEDEDIEECFKINGFVDISGWGECYIDKDAIKVDAGTDNDRDDISADDIEKNDETDDDIEEDEEHYRICRD